MFSFQTCLLSNACLFFKIRFLFEAGLPIKHINNRNNAITYLCTYQLQINKIHSELCWGRTGSIKHCLPVRQESASLKRRGSLSYEKLRIKASYLGSLRLSLAQCILKDGQWEEANAKGREASICDKGQVQSKQPKRNKKASASLKLFRLFLLLISGLWDKANASLTQEYQIHTMALWTRHVQQNNSLHSSERMR